MTEPSLMTVDEVAEYLRISVRCVQYRTLRHEIPGRVMLFGRLPRFQRNVLEEWIANGCPDCSKVQADA